MKSYIKPEAWVIREEGFDPALNRISESLFSIGNGKMGQRANFEETYTGDTLRGSYIAGVYYPDKTRVGWWKNGYPEYFAKVPNSVNWIGLEILFNGESIDLNRCKVLSFTRILNLKEGTLSRTCILELSDGSKLSVESVRFCSLEFSHAGVLQYSITPLTGSADIEIQINLDGDVHNEDANYGESFWEPMDQFSEGNRLMVQNRTFKTGFVVACASVLNCSLAGVMQTPAYDNLTGNQFAAARSRFRVERNEKLTLYRYNALLSSLDYDPSVMMSKALEYAEQAAALGFDRLLSGHVKQWEDRWQNSDIVIEGDVNAQQAIRYNIFQLYQTYTGEDSRLNIGPKGFTGEKYGGSTYWDTEAYCLPFYLATAPEHVARNLLVYRYNHLEKAIQNAAKLGFTRGAALYPMVTMNGEECHNEWEITFEEIHRNGAIAYAIFDYIRYTGDRQYLCDYGWEVLIGIARFWAQRVNWSAHQNSWVILGVTGPNEFENNVNNNWYTNKLAVWSLEYCVSAASEVRNLDPHRYADIVNKTGISADEMQGWEHICKNMYFPFDPELGIYLQQDGFLDKEQKSVADLLPSERPIVEHWSWDRILRSIYIKQADVLQGIYFFEDEFSTESIQRHFDYYEPKTVHESSLSPCVHAILAARLGMFDKAYEMYLRTARLDLDDYNNDTRDGLHITSMAGTWMSIVKGFAGMRVTGDTLHFTPFLPNNWNSLSFRIRFRGSLLNIVINASDVRIECLSGQEVNTVVHKERMDKKRVAAC